MLIALFCKLFRQIKGCPTVLPSLPDTGLPLPATSRLLWVNRVKSAPQCPWQPHIGVMTHQTIVSIKSVNEESIFLVLGFSGCVYSVCVFLHDYNESFGFINSFRRNKCSSHCPLFVFSVPPEMCLLGCVFYITDYIKIVGQPKIDNWKKVQMVTDISLIRFYHQRHVFTDALVVKYRLNLL